MIQGKKLLQLYSFCPHFFLYRYAGHKMLLNSFSSMLLLIRGDEALDWINRTFDVDLVPVDTQENSKSRLNTVQQTLFSPTLGDSFFQT